MGLKVKIRRIELNMKQKDLAKNVGITPQYLRNIEKGIATNPSIEIMKNIAKELRCSVQELFFNE